jgi:2-polyprenyl-3-methyl-5-hydroxy-6-metoxy-1,4-benzoquinol methylase
MEFTGERMIPEFNNEDEIYLEHISRYMFASKFIKNKIVLDIACGSGYGTNYLLENGAERVFGIDISEETISYCKERYKKDNIEFIQGDVAEIRMANNSVDAIVSFETIEHVDENSQLQFLREIKRVLKSDGILIISTPNEKVFPDKNSFHINELTKDEFCGLLKNNFKHSRLFFQDDLETSIIYPEGVLNLNEIELEQIGTLDSESSMYFLAVCSDISLECDYQKLVLSNIQTWKNTIDLQRIKENESEEIRELKKKIELFESSKFWKLRNFYMKFKK